MSKADLQTKATDIVIAASGPVEVQHVAKELDISWPTARNILLNLVINHKIAQLQTTSGRLLFVPAK